MERIAVVEDLVDERAALTACLERYKSQRHENIAWTCYENAYDFLESKERYDMVFLDIMMPGMNGMEAAQELRKQDRDIVIIFVTNMSTFAVKSYEVDALDYILKPISYERLEFKLTKALTMIRSRGEISLVINSLDGGIVRISSGQVYYIEVAGHRLRYCTDCGEFYEKGSLTKKAQTLEQYNFARCNTCYLVNLRHIFAVNGYTLRMRNGDELRISQPKKKEFGIKLANYMGQGKC